MRSKLSNSFIFESNAVTLRCQCLLSELPHVLQQESSLINKGTQPATHIVILFLRVQFP